MLRIPGFLLLTSFLLGFRNFVSMHGRPDVSLYSHSPLGLEELGLEVDPGVACAFATHPNFPQATPSHSDRSAHGLRHDLVTMLHADYPSSNHVDNTTN